MPVPSFLLQQAAQLGQGIAGAGMGMMLAKWQDKRQLEQQQKLQELEMKGQRGMTDYNMSKQLEMWRQTNYGAQLEQLKKAGLNPGLLYGMGGGGGATTDVKGGNVTGGHAPMGGGEVEAGMGMALQRTLTGAQVENIQAQTENIKADTLNKPKVGANIDTHTASLSQGIQNQKAVEGLTRVQTEIAQVEASVSRQTIMEQMKAWENIAEKGTQEINALKLQNALSQEQFQDKIRDLKQQIAERSIKMALMDAQRKNTNQDTQNKIQEILESITRQKTMAGHLILQWAKMDREGAQPSPEGANSDWEFLNNLMPGFLLPIGNGFKKGHTPIKGFQK